jgi:hypothetical protein
VNSGFIDCLQLGKKSFFVFKFLCGWVGFCVFGVCGLGGGDVLL